MFKHEIKTSLANNRNEMSVHIGRINVQDEDCKVMKKLVDAVQAKQEHFADRFQETVKDAQDVRDTLSRIDRIREAQEPS